MALWVTVFTRAVCDETSDPDELTAAWRDFRRQHTRGFWPTPGAVCEAIRAHRASRSEIRPRDEPRRLPPPAYHQPERVSWKVRARTLEALAAARSMPGPLGPPLVKLGEAILMRNGEEAA